ncbi:uncharacterized protein EAF02_000498 [Botrytis sinoallii]|uniref:uncharacterized protein n=1 Tax=Botrytis sinoallii TaxID=1463999 RepID=UPI00190280D9|nr:uncharacterized protein EAF02_000498 [Botrytis sinoallii]KAF7892960.1 hypothetical protein EAF02_000498 [Botrytis sinoallii]
MCTSSQTSFSSRSSKQYLSTPSASSKSDSTSSSTSQRAQHGSSASHSSSPSAISSSSQSSQQDSAEHKHQGEAIKRYENEPRDCKSWVVEEYDAHQQQASNEHWNEVERDFQGVEWAH